MTLRKTEVCWKCAVCLFSNCHCETRSGKHCVCTKKRKVERGLLENTRCWVTESQKKKRSARISLPRRRDVVFTVDISLLTDVFKDDFGTHQEVLFCADLEYVMYVHSLYFISKATVFTLMLGPLPAGLEFTSIAICINHGFKHQFLFNCHIPLIRKLK